MPITSAAKHASMHAALHCQHSIITQQRHVQLTASISSACQYEPVALSASLVNHRCSLKTGVDCSCRQQQRRIQSLKPHRARCASQAGYANAAMSIGVPPAQPRAPVSQSQTGPFWAAVILVCAALTALAGAFTAFLVYMRPVLKRMETAAMATETASKAMEKSAIEFERSNLMLLEDTPPMITEIEAAAREYHELGQTLNLMTAGFRGKNPVRDWSQLSMKRVAKDVSALTNALSPAMDQWKKRLAQIAMSFDSTHKADGSAGKQLKQESANGAISGSTDSAASGQAQTAQDRTGAAQVVDGIQKGLSSISGAAQQSGSAAAASARSSSNGAFNTPKQKQENGGQQGSQLMAQEALDLVDTASIQKGAEVINEAAIAAEEVASEANRLVEDIASSSQDGEAVEEIFQASASQDRPDMSPEEQRLLKELRTKKQAAESIFKALERAEAAAIAAATSSGALESAMQEAQAQGLVGSGGPSAQGKPHLHPAWTLPGQSQTRKRPARPSQVKQPTKKGR